MLQVNNFLIFRSVDGIVAHAGLMSAAWVLAVGAVVLGSDPKTMGPAVAVV